MKTVVRSEVAGVRLAPRQEEEISKLVGAGLFVSTSEFIREAVREKLETIRVIKIRDIPQEKAKKEILDFLAKRGQAWTSEIADELGLDLLLVTDVLEELKREGEVK